MTLDVETTQEIAHHLSMAHTYANLFREHLTAVAKKDVIPAGLLAELQAETRNIVTTLEEIKREIDKRPGYWEQVMSFWTGPFS